MQLGECYNNYHGEEVDYDRRIGMVIVRLGKFQYSA
jgi:hypothetical protein